MARATLKQVAARSGVSTFTVSQALSDKPGVSDATRERIREIAEEMGYVANLAAASLRGAASSAVGVLTANGRNQYYATLVQGISASLQEHNYFAVANDTMRNAQYSAELEKKAVEGLLQQRVSAVIATYSLKPENMRLLNKWQIPVLFVDSPPPSEFSTLPFIGVDNYQASALVAEHLALKGHDSALFVVFDHAWSTREGREKGFSETAKLRGMRTDVLEVPNDSEAVAKSLIEYFKNGFEPGSEVTAIYAANTIILHGVLTALKTLRLRVPHEISVVAFDDFDWAEHIDPPITVVDQSIYEIGLKAGQKVVELLQNSTAAEGENTTLLSARLIERGSVRALLQR